MPSIEALLVHELPDDAEIDVRDQPSPGPTPSDEALAHIALREAMSSAQWRTFASGRAIAVIVEVPGPDWVTPVRRACMRSAHWSEAFARSGSSRTEDRPDRGNEAVADRLARGYRVLGVSQSPSTLLPAALLSACDLHITIAPPSTRVLARTIRAATGGAPRDIPDALASTLSYAEIAAAIRIGASPRSCLDRLRAVAAGKKAADPAVAGAPAFADLRGFGDAHRWGSRLVAEMQAWRNGELDISLIDRNAVLHSAPGLGKTTFVRSLANASGLHLISTSVAVWFADSSGYLDGVVRQINHVFATASQKPTLLFIDEIESIPNRATLEGRARDFWSTIVTNMLTRIEEVDARKLPIAIVGATNYFSLLDTALVRPGRLYPAFEILPPTAEDLAAILAQHGGEDLAGMDLAAVAALGVSASGATAAAWVKAARARARQDGRPVRFADLLESVAPPDDRPAEVLRRIAVHEISHAVSSELLDCGRVHHVSLVRTPGAGASTVIAGRRSPTASRADIERTVASLLAGRAGELEFFGEATVGSGGTTDSDLAQATRLIAGLHGSFGLGDNLLFRGSLDRTDDFLGHDRRMQEIVEGELRRLQESARSFVRTNAALIVGIADVLVERRVLSGDELRRMISAATEHRPN